MDTEAEGLGDGRSRSREHRERACHSDAGGAGVGLAPRLRVYKGGIAVAFGGFKAPRQSEVGKCDVHA